jgi:hypothetical protein
MENQNEYNKEMAELFYNTYMGCLKYKNNNLKKNINCDNYYNKFKYFSDKYENSNNNNNH